MKYFSRLLFVSLMFFNQTTSFSSHVLGGDIMYKSLGSDSFLVQVNLLFDCNIPSGSSAINVQCTSSCYAVPPITANLVNPGSTEISNYCPADLSNTVCNGGSFPGVQIWSYFGYVSLPGPCSDWSFSWEACCRYATSTNLSNAASSGIFIEATLDNSINSSDNSPVFGQFSVPNYFAGQDIELDLEVTEPDCDSLVFSLEDAQETSGTPVTYSGPFSGTIQ